MPNDHKLVKPLHSENKRVRELVRQILTELGEDPEREGLQRTPKRVDRALHFLTAGYHQDIDELLNGALFEEKYNEMVIVKDIDFYSLCEHHLLPFYGKCHVAYIPNGKVVGLSKIPRIVDVFARRLQLQERLTTQIAKAIMKALQPEGVAVVTEARHLCMMMRGVQKQNTVVTNSALLGIFHDDRACREEFMQLIGHRQMG
jgi:GTP cyclohydrolase I